MAPSSTRGAANGHSTHRAEGPPRPTDPAALTDEVLDALRGVGGHLERWGGDLAALGRVQVDRARHAARNGILAFVFGTGACIAGTTALVAGVLYTLGGISGGVAEATRRPWLGDLAAGVVTLATVAGLALAARGALRRRELARLRARGLREEQASTRRDPRTSA